MRNPHSSSKSGKISDHRDDKCPTSESILCNDLQNMAARKGTGRKQLRILEMIKDSSHFAHKMATQNLGKKQKEVLDALRFFPDATNMEIAAHLKWPINRVTPRMRELRKQDLVLQAGRRTCKVTGGRAQAWMAKHPVLSLPK
jgi:hypothetical protein